MKQFSERGGVLLLTKETKTIVRLIVHPSYQTFSILRYLYLFLVYHLLCFCFLSSLSELALRNLHCPFKRSIGKIERSRKRQDCSGGAKKPGDRDLRSRLKPTWPRSLSLFRFISVIAPFSVALHLLTECLKQAKSFKINKILNAEEKKITSTIAT